MRRFFRSIKSRILVSYFLYVLLIVLISLGVLYFQAKNKLYNLTSENILGESRLYSEIISEKLEKDILTLKHAAENIKIRDFEEESIQDNLKAIIAANKGRELNSIYAAENGYGIDENGTKFFIHDRDYFKILKNSYREYYVSDPLIGRITMKPIVVVAVPLKDNRNKFRGIVGISMKLTELSELISDIKLEHESFAWVVSESGLVVSHPNEEYQMNANIKNLGEYGFNDFHKISKEILALDEGVGEYFDSNINEKKLLTYTKIRVAPNWKLCVSIGYNEIFIDANDIWKKTLFITVFMAILFLLIIVKASDSIINPIKELTESVKKSVSSNFSPLDLNISNDKEIEELIVTYNEMNVAISVYTEELEMLVEERTEELELLNQKLSERNEKLSVENETLQEKATKDVLTGLHNRRMLNTKLNFIVQEIRGQVMKECSILFMDLDNFKYYNDTFGHSIGDKLLKFLADHFIGAMRKNDFIARYGGDEFVIVLPNVDEDVATQIKYDLSDGVADFNGLSNKIREWMEVKEIHIDKEKLLGLSIGVYHFDENNLDTVKNLIIKADEQMYEEKSLRKKNK